MVKTPKVRHSRPHRQPVTIELGADDVSRTTGESPKPETAAEHVRQASPEPAADTAVSEAPDPTSAPGTEEFASTPKETPRRAFDYGFDEQPAADGDAKVRRPADQARPVDAGGRNGAGAEAPMPQAEARGGQGMGGRIAAGVVGGIVALVGAGALQYAGLFGAPGSGGDADLGGQIADLRGEVAALKNGGDNGAGTRIDGLSAALDQVKADVVSLKAAVDAGQGGDGAGLTELSGKVAEIEKAVAALGENGDAQPTDLGPVNERLAALEAQLKSVGDATDAQESRLAALEQSVSQLSARVDAQASQPKIALAIAAAALKSALERGVPFSAELDTFAAITPDAPQIGALRAYAEKGVPARATIAAGMDDAANRMVAAAAPSDPDAGFLQRLLTSAESLVKVRPIGVVEGTGVPETVARMEVAVKQGDYAKALAEYDTLPEAAKAAGADFAADLKARLDAEAQLDALISGAMKA